MTMVMRGGVSVRQRLRLGDCNHVMAYDPASNRRAPERRLLLGRGRGRGAGAAAAVGELERGCCPTHPALSCPAIPALPADVSACLPACLRVLKYDLRPGGNLLLDCGLFSERDGIHFRSDLVDTNIYLCAPEVLMLFSDNFDYQDVGRDFVPGVLSEVRGTGT